MRLPLFSGLIVATALVCAGCSSPVDAANPSIVRNQVREAITDLLLALIRSDSEAIARLVAPDAVVWTGTKPGQGRTSSLQAPRPESDGAAPIFAEVISVETFGDGAFARVRWAEKASAAPERDRIELQAWRREASGDWRLIQSVRR